MNIQDRLVAYLTKRDGSVRRSGKAMLALAEATGYSIESLRSYAYGRRSPSQEPRLKILKEKIRRG